MNPEKLEFLQKLYSNPKYGLGGQQKFYKKAKELDNSITMKDIQELFRHNTTAQLHKPVPKATNLPIVGNVGAYQGDLIFFPQYKKQNKNYIGAFIAVGIASRYAYAYAIKTKSAVELDGIIQQFIKDAHHDHKDIKILESDNGSEFLNRSVQKTLKDNHIVHNTADIGNHNALGKIDRFSRTIKGYVSKYMSDNNTTNWIDVFNDLIYNYNNTEHSSIKMKPAKVSLKKEAQIVHQAGEDWFENIGQTQHIKVGDLVRVPVKKSLFKKEGQYYSEGVYVVDDVSSSLVSIKNINGNVLKTRYNINQVLKVDANSVPANVDNIKLAKKIAKVDRTLQKEGLSEENVKAKSKRTASVNATAKIQAIKWQYGQK